VRVTVLDYDCGVLRRLTAAALVILVQIGAISAPFTHVHLDLELTHHHHGQALHAHLGGHEAVEPLLPGTRIDHEDEAGRTVTPQVFVAGATKSFDLPAIASPPFAFVVGPAQPRGRRPQVAHGPDPPSLSVRTPRAPPLQLS
jgi:hypothetical protein